MHPRERPGPRARRGLDADDEIRDGAWVAELTELLDLTSWPAGMRVIARRERAQPCAQLRIIDIDGHRVTAFATNTRAGGPGTPSRPTSSYGTSDGPGVNRIRTAKDKGLRAFPLFDFAQDQIWCAIVALAVEVTAWRQMLALAGHDARRWEPKRPLLRLFTVPATLARTGQRVLLHLAAKAPWAGVALEAISRLRALAVPTEAPATRPDQPA